MEVFLLEPDKFQQLYNCSIYPVQQVPLDQRRQIFLGSLSIGLSLIFELFYIPCLFAIWRHLELSCYKIMFCISLADICALFVAGFLTGLFGIQGTVYCSNPRLVFAAGIAGSFFYGLETSAAVLLAATRCLEMSFPYWANRFFGGRKTWFWLCFAWFYAIYYAFYNNVVLFNSIRYAWLFNPHVGYIDGLDNLYTSYVDLVHETSVLTLTLLFYFLFIISVIKKHRGSQKNAPVQNTKKIVFLQIFLISVLNSMVTIAYILLALVDVSESVFIAFGTFGWLFLHGLPPLIYLSVNRTLRQECLQIIKRIGGRKAKEKKKNQAAVHKISSAIPVSYNPYRLRAASARL